MKKFTINMQTALIVALLVPAQQLLAATIYTNDFESGTVVADSNPAPGEVWGLQDSFNRHFGTENNFEIVNTTSHDGTYSLRFDYSGRNGICNVCGTYRAEHISSGHDNAPNYIIANPADPVTDLTSIDNPNTTKADDGPAAAPGRRLYNQDNGWSLWEIESISTENTLNDRLNVKLISGGINGETPEFNGGDAVSIARECGVDGHVGGIVNRRSDCDSVISFFSKVDGSQAPDQSFFRRIYIKAEVSSPNLHNKLRYWTSNRYTLPSGNLAGVLIILAGDSSNGKIVPQVSGLGQVGGKGTYLPDTNMPTEFPGSTTPIEFERGEWYYIEEEFHASSTTGATHPTTGLPIYNEDGEYRLWMNKSADANVTDSPIVDATGLMLPPVRQASFWGNVQHQSHSVGVWFMDDLEIASDNRIGPLSTAPSGTNTATPKAPTVSSN